MNRKIFISTIIGIIVISAAYSVNQRANVVSSNEFTTTTDSNFEPSMHATKIEDSSPAIKNQIHNSNKETNHKNTHTLSPIDRLRSITDKTDLQAQVIDEHDQFKRYPSENRAFESEDKDPVQQRYDVDERTTINDDSGMGLTIWSDEKFYLLNDTVNVYAFLQDPEGQKQATKFISSIYFNETHALGELTLIDEDGDGIYQGTFELSQKNTLGYGAGIYKIRIQDLKNKITDSVTFTLSQPDIALTGNYKEHINSEGNLIIDAEVSITSNNNFYIQASLYSSTNVAIGITQFSQQLTSGTHWIPLSFSGLMIQDAQETGPFVLKKVSVAKVTMPMQRAPLVEPEFHTDSYSLSEFAQQ